jgi:hypothetical protein
MAYRLGHTPDGFELSTGYRIKDGVLARLLVYYIAEGDAGCNRLLVKRTAMRRLS